MKRIGITCDTWKVPFYREFLLKEGYVLTRDVALNDEVHVFSFDVPKEQYAKIVNSLQPRLRKLDFEIKNRN